MDARHYITKSWFEVLLLLLIAPAITSAQNAQTEKGQQTPPPGEGRIYNLTNRPFAFQLHRRDGVSWTDNYVVEPGKYFSIQVPKPEERSSDFIGITGNGKGHVIVRYPSPKLGGNLALRLPATNPQNGQLQPTWFAVEDSNGVVRLVQQPNVEQAMARQEELKSQPPLSAAELEAIKKTLRSNWVLTN
ncbi:MAG TPA: hypothetical protein VGN12_21320 [Pirellulales bacterium]|jgi:hypothetical protein